MKIWKISGTGMKVTVLMIGAESFDEALAQARKIDPRYDAGQLAYQDGEEDKSESESI